MHKKAKQVSIDADQVGNSPRTDIYPFMCSQAIHYC